MRRAHGIARLPVSAQPQVPAALTIALPDAVLDQIAQRVAQILTEATPESVDGGYLDVQGAADYLACGKDRIYALVSAREIPHHRDGRRLLFDPAELRAYVLAGGAKRP
jgi:excisionase family DNA binding protein